MDRVGVEPTTSTLLKGNSIFYLNGQQLWKLEVNLQYGSLFKLQAVINSQG
jgi:hypothetical protein